MSKEIKYFVKNISTGEEIEVLNRGSLESKKDFNLFLPVDFKSENGDGEFTEEEALQNGFFFNNADHTGDFVDRITNDEPQLDETGTWDIITKEVEE